jgi:hypothetical protein
MKGSVAVMKKLTWILSFIEKLHYSLSLSVLARPLAHPPDSRRRKKKYNALILNQQISPSYKKKQQK